MKDVEPVPGYYIFVTADLFDNDKGAVGLREAECDCHVLLLQCWLRGICEAEEAFKKLIWITIAIDDPKSIDDVI